MKKLFSLLVFAPIAIVLIALSVANRHPVQFSLDPINTNQPFLAVSLPFFVFLFIALLTGLILGGMVTWLSQAKHRKLARQTKRQATKWRHEAGEQKQRAEQAEVAISDGDPKPQQNTLSIPNKAA
jgi:uncharacterized integral membrane protein